MTAAVLLLLAVAYAVGAIRLRRRGRHGAALGRRHVVAFGCGLAVAALAQLPALDAAAHGSFAPHMVQHELLMVVAAPLLALGRPGVALPHALFMSTRRAFSAPPLRMTRRALRGPGGLAAAFALHSVVLWAWHMPAAYDASLHAASLHGLQHVAFFGTGVVFWTAALRMARTAALAPLAVLASFAMVLHTGVLGALLTLAPRPLYDHPGSTFATRLADQQLGGLIMWVPGCTAYMVLGLVVAWSLLSRRAGRGTEATVMSGGTW